MTNYAAVYIGFSLASAIETCLSVYLLTHGWEKCAIALFAMTILSAFAVETRLNYWKDRT